MPGEFVSYNNQYPFAFPQVNPASYYSYGYNTYVDPRGFRRFDSNNNSTDESIHLIQRRKSNGKDKSYSVSRERLEVQKRESEKKEITQSSEKGAVNSDSEKSKKKEKKSSSDNKSSTKNKKRRDIKREVYTEEYFITDQNQFAQFDPNFYPTPYVEQYQEQYIDQYQAPYYEQYHQQVVCPGGPPLVPNQYAPIGDSLVHNSIAYVHDAIIEPIVTVGPRTDMENGFYVTDVNNGSTNSVPGGPVFQQAQAYQYDYLVDQNSSFYPQQQQQQVQQQAQIEAVPCQQNYNDGSLPPGSKLVAEYILGYLEESGSQNAESVKKDEKVVIEMWEKSKKSSKSKSKHSHQSQFSESAKPSIAQQSESPKLAKRSLTSNIAAAVAASGGAFGDDVKDTKEMTAFKSEIIQTIQSELQNLKLNVEKADGAPIQPIFLMPQQQEQAPQKPIYVPRNVYVPVIRPVFVPRERIIVRPQIVHVARPVLVDRPVPVQQKPIVIERDRPVPIRVETIEKVEDLETTTKKVEAAFEEASAAAAALNGSSFGDEAVREIIDDANFNAAQYTAAANEATNYEYAPIDYQKLLNDASVNYNSVNYDVVIDKSNPEESGAYGYSNNYQDIADYEESRKKQEITQLLDEVERKKLSLKQTASAPYTLEVYDSTVSDKFEKVDQTSLKNLYGIEPYQYLATADSNGVFNAAQSQSYTYTTQTQDILTSNNSANVVLEGTVTNTSQVPTPRSSISNINQVPVVIQSTQKMVQNFASPYIVDQK